MSFLVAGILQLLRILHTHMLRSSRRLAQSTKRMEYFYDHQTDKLSITVGDLAEYAASQELAPGMLLHVDARRRPLALEISGAKNAVSVSGLMSFEQKAIRGDELAQRMSASENGRRAWRALTCLHLVRAS